MNPIRSVQIKSADSFLGKTGIITKSNTVRHKDPIAKAKPVGSPLTLHCRHRAIENDPASVKQYSPHFGQNRNERVFLPFIFITFVLLLLICVFFVHCFYLSQRHRVHRGFALCVL